MVAQSFRGKFAAGAAVAWLALGLLAAGCGESESTGSEGATGRGESAKTKERKQAAQAIRREMKALQRRYPAADDCKGSVLVNAHASCVLAENAESIYYAEVYAGPATITPFEPRVGRDVPIHCSGGSPHKCTNGKVVVYFP